jgi:phage/plasmid-associated DNA primase
MKFLDDLCCGKEDRKKYLGSILYSIVLSALQFQIIVYIFGPGASGKSQLPTLLIALLRGTLYYFTNFISFRI